MARVIWGETGQRFFEAGIDRGVLYVNNGPGVPWSGLTSVEENPSVGDPKAFYLDGVQYLNLPGNEQFEATLSAFFSPPEFDSCDGTMALGPGVYVTQQARKSFDLTYRTLIGNDTEGTDHAYKIHLVYNALASPTTRPHNTLSSEASLEPLSWSITTKPEDIPGAMPSAHIFIDSRDTDPLILEQIEDILYGSEERNPQMITPQELLELLSAGLIITVLSDGMFSAEGDAVYEPSSGVYGIDHERVVINDDGTFTVSS